MPMAETGGWQCSNAYLRDFVYHFASLLSDRLDKALILKAMSGQSSTYEL